MIAAIICIAVMTNLGLTLGSYMVLRRRLELIRDDVSRIRVVRTVPINGSGRLAPTPEELQAAKNRMDALGIAHPGGPG